MTKEQDTNAEGAAPSATPPANAVTQADIEAAKQAAKAEALAQFKEATGFDSLDAYKTDKLKNEGKLQELADKHQGDAQAYKAKFEKTAIDNAILSASTEALDTSVVNALLAGKAICDEDGKVTIDGKPVADAVKALLTEKPYLAKAQGTAGSGAATAAGASNGAKQLLRSDFDNLDAAARRQFVLDGGKVTD